MIVIYLSVCVHGHPSNSQSPGINGSRFPQIVVFYIIYSLYEKALTFRLLVVLHQVQSLGQENANKFFFGIRQLTIRYLGH
jgi:hypothetical protein